MGNELLIYICDDEADAVEAIETLIHQERTLRVRTESFSSGEELLPALKTRLPDLLILDIFMEGMDGIAVLRQIRTIARDLPVALYSTSTDFALEGYRLKAVRYLEKPVKQADVRELLRFLRKTQIGRPLFHLGPNESVPLADILYFEQQKHKIVLHLTTGEERTYYGKLDQLESLSPAFVRSHKSYLVNLDHVVAIDRELSVFRMRNGSMAYIRKGELPAMKRCYEERLIERVRSE